MYSIYIYSRSIYIYIYIKVLYVKDQLTTFGQKVFVLVLHVNMEL